MSPTARSLAHLRDLGARAQVVEKWIPGKPFGRRVDLFGFVDLIALEPGRTGVLGVQATTTGHVAHRLEKIRTECRDAALHWLETGNRIEIHGWSKKGARGKRKLWTLTVRPITVEELDWRRKI